MAVIEKVGVASLVKVFGVMYAIIGLIFGILFAIFGTAIYTVSGGGLAGGGMMAGLGFAIIIVYPIILGVIGLIGGALTGWIFNLVSGWVGGIEVEIKQ